MQIDPIAIALALLSADFGESNWHLTLDFSPDGDLRMFSDGQMESTGTDPQLFIHKFDRGTRSNWIKFGFEFDGDVSFFYPKLYVFFDDSEKDFCEIDFPRVLPNQLICKTIYIPNDYFRIRFDPCEFPCEFRIKQLFVCKSDWADIRDDIESRFDDRDYENVRKSFSSFANPLFKDMLLKEHRATNNQDSYGTWRETFSVLSQKKMREIETILTGIHQRPMFSVVMSTYNTSEGFLIDAIESVLCQNYDNFEFCIVDDASTSSHVRRLLDHYAAKDSRVRLHYRDSNGNISTATNDGIRMTKGEWIVFFDHDDILAKHALAFVALAIVASPKAEFIYSDEDKVNELNEYFHPFFVTTQGVRRSAEGC
ncbi:glycosyltransferase [Lichenibacterium ramalinae]|nr:glycosyltransferase [Lichenibacterium ramalinae]